MTGTPNADDLKDAHVDEEIIACLNLDKPKSFFLFAGAGSGKTGSLVRAINAIRPKVGRRLLLANQQIGIITYTNKAANEIKSRLNYDPLVHVSTIHSFAWKLIGGFNNDIREWLRVKLTNDIADLKAELAANRQGTKIAVTRALSLESKTERLAGLDGIRIFSYDPDGDNVGKDSLNHSEVIGITSSFLVEKAGLRLVLTDKYPVLLIDESQDTNKLLLEALLSVQNALPKQFCLGLFGDVMQRIYADGKADLADSIPQDWATPKKVMNHRCGKRIVRLINKIRAPVDGAEQQPRSDSPEGTARLYIFPDITVDKAEVEKFVRTAMQAASDDKGWIDGEVKSLVLEHHMAASRLGFSELFSSLYPVERLRTGLLKGELSALKLFSKEVLPLRRHMEKQDHFGATAILRTRSPLLARKKLKEMGEDQPEALKAVKNAADKLNQVWIDFPSPTFQNVLRPILETGLFNVPKNLASASQVLEILEEANISFDDLDEGDNDADDWSAFLSVPFAQIESFSTYVDSKATFDTHQGVKGLEFERVLVVMDDETARGFMFSYDALFNAKPPSKSAAEGKESSADRTRRLFYVTCSRAERGLALVAYSKNPEAVKRYAVESGMFSADEVFVGNANGLF